MATPSADDASIAFEDVLSYDSWWDCPRFGVALLNGAPHYFESQFSADLDDYSDEFRLWPISADALEREQAHFAHFAQWRAAFDAGAEPPPLDDDQAFAAEGAALDAGPRRSPGHVLTAVPVWKLDRDHSFAGRVPSHKVCWRLIPER